MAVLSAGFERLWRENYVAAARQQGALRGVLPNSDWAVDFSRRTYKTGGVVLQISLLGSYALKERTWLWGWGNPSFGLDHVAVIPTLRLRRIGEAMGVPELEAMEEFALYEEGEEAGDQGRRVALVASALLRQGGVIEAAYDRGVAYLSVDDLMVPRTWPEEAGPREGMPRAETAVAKLPEWSPHFAIPVTNVEIPGYEIAALLGSGGHAMVFHGTDVGLGREVAIKIINRKVEGERDRRRFDREVNATVRLSEHPNVVTLYGAGTLEDGRPFLVTEFCPGGSLDDRLRRGGTLPPAEVRNIGMQVADAVADAHRLGVIHRDIKPANLLFTRFRRVALADFGIAVLPGVDLSVTHSMTLLYAAPEVLRGGVGEKVCDVYSLGVTLYELLAGRTPHDPDHNLPIRALIDELLRLQEGPVPDIPGVHPSFMAVIRTALHTDPGRRYQHAGQMQDALAQVIA